MSKLNKLYTSAYVKASWAGNKIRNRADEVVKDESGMEIIAVVLIIVIVIALAVAFRGYITDFFKKIWEKIFGDAQSGGFTNVRGFNAP